MTLAGELMTSPSTRTGSSKVFLVAAVLAAANLLALLLNIILGVLAYYEEHETTYYVVPQDIWFPFIVAAWAQVVVNGMVLVAWKRTRPAGLGVLLGASVRASIARTTAAMSANP